MATMRLTAVVMNSSRRYTLMLNDREAVGAVAAFLSQQEDAIDARTLEIARPLGMTQRLSDLDLQSGDRLLVFTRPSEPAELPPALMPGDKVLKFIMGDMTVNSRGKRRLLIGKPDESSGLMPDVDLRNFVGPKFINFVSRETARLDFDDQRKQWYAARVGRTRIMIDDLELGTDRIPVSSNFVMRLYKGSDAPNTGASPIAEIAVQMETVESRSDIVYLSSGAMPLPLHIGLEKDALRVNASLNMSVEKTAEGLLKFYNLNVTPETKVYLLRLMAPATRLNELRLNADEFLYASRRAAFTQNVMILRSTADRALYYELAGGQDENEKLIGRRPQPDTEDPELDVDLFRVLVPRAEGGETYRKISRRQARVYFRPAENTWWLKLEERTAVPVFINNVRVVAGAPVPLTSGDVLSIGPGVDDYYARLEVEIVAKTD